MSEEELELELHLALFEDDDRSGLLADEHRWIVRSLDHDIFGYGMTQRDALLHFFLSLEQEIEDAKAEHRKPFEGVSKASENFIAWWRTKKVHQIKVPREVAAKAPRRSSVKVMESDAVAL